MYMFYKLAIFEKKFLTKGMKCGNIYKSLDESGERKAKESAMYSGFE